jgi:hypothetical protein
MPGFRTEVRHPLGREAAAERLKSFLDQVAQRYKEQVSSLEGDWTDNVLAFTLTTYGFKIPGTLTVEDDVAVIEGQLPFAAVAFRGKIESSIKSALEKALVG